jgi:hypothetical protein
MVLRNGHIVKGNQAQIVPEMPVLLTGSLQFLREQPVQLIVLVRVARMNSFLFLPLKWQ